jgi:hypothetical protein
MSPMSVQPTSFGYSKKVFAFDTTSYDCQLNKGGSYSCSCTIIKFGVRKATRRRAAFMGTAWIRSDTPLSYDEFVKKIRHFNASLSWDGVEVWGTTPLKEQIAVFEYLDPILANEPSLPSGFDGWWEESPLDKGTY